VYGKKIPEDQIILLHATQSVYLAILIARSRPGNVRSLRRMLPTLAPWSSREPFYL